MPQRIVIKGATFTFYIPEFNEHVRKIYVFRLHQAAEEVKTQVQKNISQPSSHGTSRSKPGEYPHTETGRLRNSIFTKVDDGKMTAIVGTSMLYGLFLEFGTEGGTVIIPISKQALHWIDPETGEDRFARSVRLGAIQDRSFLRRTVYEQKRRIREIFNRPLPPMPKSA